MYCLEDCIAFITKKVSEELSNELENRLKSYNITRTQWMILYYINLTPNISQRQLADLLAIKESSIVRQLDKMEILGWLNRKQSKIDKRVKIVNLTDLGKEMELSIRPVVESFKSDVTKNIGNDDLVIFRTVLDKMSKNIK